MKKSNAKKTQTVSYTFETVAKTAQHIFETNMNIGDAFNFLINLYHTQIMGKEFDKQLETEAIYNAKDFVFICMGYVAKEQNQ